MKVISKTATAVIVAVMFVVFLYGLVRFPDGPIHPCDPNGYCGKQGQPHTAQQYRAYRNWETTMLYLWPVGLISLVLLNRGRRGKHTADTGEV